MNILGINSCIDRSSAFSSVNNRLSAALEQHFTHALPERAFPHNSIASFNESWDVVATTAINADIRANIRKHTLATIELVDYRAALSMATIATRNWDTCAVIAIDSETSSLGYYANKSFHWLREFDHPNSLALFVAAANRLLGFNPLLGDEPAKQLSIGGTTIYESWILDKIIHIGDGSYQLMHDLSRGVGVASPNPDIAASVYSVYTSVMLSLARWLAKQTGCSRVAIVGQAATNYFSNTAILDEGIFEEIATLPISGAAATAIGAAAMLHRPLIEHSYLGVESSSYQTPEQVAELLLRGQVVKYINGRREFSDTSFVNNNAIFIPFIPLVSSNNYYHICQQRDFNTYYSCKAEPTHGQYLSRVIHESIQGDTVRAVTVSSNRNAFMNRVLELTRAQGYPIIFSKEL